MENINNDNLQEPIQDSPVEPEQDSPVEPTQDPSIEPVQDSSQIDTEVSRLISMVEGMSTVITALSTEIANTKAAVELISSSIKVADAKIDEGMTSNKTSYEELLKTAIERGI